MTAEGVEVEGIPVLHVCVGAAQPDALVDVKGDRSLMSFYRERVDTIELSNKRPLNQKTVMVSRKKPTLRASKQQKMEDLLTGFGAQAAN